MVEQIAKKYGFSYKKEEDVCWHFDYNKNEMKRTCKGVREYILAKNILGDFCNWICVRNQKQIETLGSTEELDLWFSKTRTDLRQEDIQQFLHELALYTHTSRSLFSFVGENDLKAMQKR